VGGAGPARECVLKRLRLRVRGTVQGVGFRPYVYGLAQRFGLSGLVYNDGDGVVVEVEGYDTDFFLAQLRTEAPPLAHLDSIEMEDMPPDGQKGFAIHKSRSGKIVTSIPADAATCPQCLEDLFDPSSRFYLYPFVTCTHCGPRLTITHRLPYDRVHTSMAAFPFCPACSEDYADPASRRYHAEALACPACGPKLSHSIAEIVRALVGGQIVAVKGIGGYHLMCDADDEAAVLRLRRRKSRDAKPFAVMVADVDQARLIAHLDEREGQLLAHRSSPIVLLRSRQKVALSVAPNLATLGVILPYSPLQHLIFQQLASFQSVKNLVVTSANPGGEPLITDDDAAQLQLQSIGDLIVSHDRPIVTRADDSVMAVHGSGPVFLRRARGFVPDSIPLSGDGPAVLALGAHLKVTVTVTRGREAFVSQHVGCLDNAATIDFFEQTVEHLLDLTGVHPDLYSSRFAERFGVAIVPVQHHLAHVAAVVAEHQVEGPVLGVALDGHGYGVDGGNWGGELILLNGADWQRIGSLAPLPMPGGDRAAREPWRMGMAVLSRLGHADGRFDQIAGACQLGQMMPRLAMPQTSSLGRVFDAAAALLGICLVQDYEGQAAMELEARVGTPRILDQGYHLDGGTLDLLPLLDGLCLTGLSATLGAELFHGTLAQALTQWIVASAARYGLSTIALGGGCMINRVLADLLVKALTDYQLRVIVPSRVPAGDGGLSLGQAYIGRL
jgi:hydrogenase maturation protein HypF